jgi:hypothetical protein
MRRSRSAFNGSYWKVRSIRRTIEISALSCKSVSECSIGSSCPEQTFSVVDLNGRLWSRLCKNVSSSAKLTTSESASPISRTERILCQFSANQSYAAERVIDVFTQPRSRAVMTPIVDTLPPVFFRQGTIG